MKLSVLFAAVALLLAGSARADTIALVWQGTGGAVTTQASSATITANIVLTISSSNINAISWDILWDDELAYVTSTTGGGIGNWSDGSGLNATGRSPGTSPGDQGTYAFDSGSPILSMTQGTATVGTITFHVTAAVASDGAPGSAPGTGGPPFPVPGDVSPNFADTITGQACFLTQGGYCTGSVTFSGASVDVIPEPGTLGLFALGLAALGVVGSGSQRRGS